jgi:hypothetical protein
MIEYLIPGGNGCGQEKTDRLEACPTLEVGPNNRFAKAKINAGFAPAKRENKLVGPATPPGNGVAGSGK